MRIKKYNLYKTVKKTAKENNLVIAERQRDTYKLFDFSELDNIGLPEEEKEYIKETALQHVCGAFLESFYGKEIDNFSFFDGTARFHCHRVYNEHGKLLYRIFQLVSLEHKKYCRKSIYEKYHATTWIIHNIWAAPSDIEI